MSSEEFYYIGSPTEIAHQRQEAEGHARQSAFVERFAKCWRAIGQPSTKGCHVVVAVDTDDHADIPETVLGMPVFEMESLINGKSVGIVTSYDCWSDLPSRFSLEW